VWVTKSKVLVRTLDGASAFGKAFTGLYKDIGLMTTQYGPGLLLSSAKNPLNAQRVMFVSGATVDITAKFVNPAIPEFWNEDGGTVKPRITNFSEFAEKHTVSASECG
jgi:hypothetical protein